MGTSRSGAQRRHHAPRSPDVKPTPVWFRLRRVRVVCVVPVANTETVERAQEQGVTLVPLPYTPADLKLDSRHAPSAVEALGAIGVLNSEQDLLWLGHDRITGAVALAAKMLAGGRVAMIHHMSYTHYEAFAESASSAYEKSEVQRALFAQADVLFAIGPLLRDALGDLLPGREVMTLIPGVDELPTSPAPRTFTGFLSGRLSADAAKIKQGHLGVAAFATAHKRAYKDLGFPDALKIQPRLILRGVDIESQSPSTGQPDVAYWNRFAEAYADRVVNIQALTYTTQRKALLDELSRATVALMPSWHEGFGLAGWEAVAAGVPLIVSENSGLYRLLREHKNGAWLNWVFAVDVRGRVDEPFFHEEDLKAVSDRLLEIANSPKEAREKAVSLREGASSDFSWRHCIDAALLGLQWLNPERQAVASTAPTTTTSSATDFPRSAGESKESPLELPSPKWRVGSGLADSQLLRAEEAAVPFDAAREPEITSLIAWTYDTEYPQALRLMTGGAGTGKTRLALELCRRLDLKGWHCGFLPAEIGKVEAAGAWNDLRRRTEPLLVVFDYAETRQDTVLAFIRALLQEEVRSPVRLLLLARDGGEWWDRLPTRDAVCEPFLSGYTTSGPFVLPPLHVSPFQREAAFRLAVTAYAHRLAVADTPRLEVDLTGEHFNRPLYVQIAAILALYGDRPASAEGLTRALLHHERRYWHRLLRDSAGADDRHAAELMVLTTLAGGFARVKDAREAWELWSESSGNELDSSLQRALFERLTPLYPGQQGLAPLRPDLLGEALVAQALLYAHGASLLDALLGPKVGVSQRRNALTVIARLSKHRPDIETTVVRSLSRNLAACAVDLVHVVTQNDSRLPEWAEQAFASLPNPVRYQVSGLLLPALQYQSVQLSGLGCAVAQADVDKSRRKLAGKPNDVSLLATYAASLQNYALALSRAGRMAADISRQSVDIFERLARKNPDVYTARWASSLSGYSSDLSADGRHEEAIHYGRVALKVYERLALQNPKTFEPDLAGILSNYANRLFNVGDRDQALVFAEKALQLRRKLVAADAERYEPDLAGVLNNCSQFLSDSGDVGAALLRVEEALSIYERLATNNPDRYEPDWAMSLSNYAISLAENGRYSDAREAESIALKIRGKLAQKNADRFEADFATSLGSYARRLADLGEYDEALVYQEQAAGTFARLAAKTPLRFAEPAYLNLISLSLLKWLREEESSISFDAPLPDSSIIQPHRLPILKAWRAWLQGCTAVDEGRRESAFKVVLVCASELNSARLRDIEEAWLCSAAWSAAHAPHVINVVDWQIPWISHWHLYLRRHGFILPAWMKEIETRLGIIWPHSGTSLM